MVKKKVTTFVDAEVKKKLVELALKRQVSEYQVAADFIIEGVNRVERGLETRTGEDSEGATRPTPTAPWQLGFKDRAPANPFKRGRK